MHEHPSMLHELEGHGVLHPAVGREQLVDELAMHFFMDGQQNVPVEH